MTVLKSCRIYTVDGTIGAMSVPGYISVEEAASRLGVIPRRVRAMIAHGLLEAEKVGSEWLVEVASVEVRNALRAEGGRPFAPKNAWGAVWVASGMKPQWLSASERSRLKHRLEDPSELEALAPMLRSRSEVHALRADEADVSEIANRRDVVLSGVSAAPEYGLDIRAPGVVEGYVHHDDFEQIIREFGLQRSSRPNAILRVPRDVWPFSDGQHIAPIGVVIADLLQSSDERTRRAGHQAAEGLAP
jgi:excisionase family DNA binding protein